MINANILIVDDNRSVLSALEILLQFEYKQVQTLESPKQMQAFANLEEVDIVLLDMNFSAGVNTGNEGLFWLKEIKKKSPDTQVILMTAYGAIDLAVKALKDGAADFVLKPWSNEKLLATIKSAYSLRKSQKEVKQLKQKESRLKQLISQDKPQIIGDSPALSTILNLVAKVAKTDVNVLVTGENGTGKELIAKELHYCSARKDELFIGVDMGSIAESLFESELFGHTKGAFTDAKEDRVGKFEAANGGTLFLDEIGNLSLPMQAKLLSVIQNRTIFRVGSNKPIKVDIRLICATNSQLEEMVAEGLFREDLLYRINTIQLEVPPLRDRGTDVLALADFYLQQYAQKYDKSSMKLNNKAKEKLLAHTWPGNVRELRHTIERSVILCDGNVLQADDFLFSIKNTNQVVENGPSTLAEMEMKMIRKALEKHDGNHSAAAVELGITRQTLYNKVKKMEGK